MGRIAGIQVERNAKGKPTHIRIDLKKWGDLLEDFLDKIDVELRRDEETFPWEDVKKKLDKKHGLK
jgi:hypothetical protein